MRTIKDIENDILDIDKEIGNLRDLRQFFVQERTEAYFSAFCEEYNLKAGDVVYLKDKSFSVMIISSYNINPSWIVCRKIKNDGEPDASTCAIDINRFDKDNITFIEHRDINNESK
jgi:hypothetical protein